jgi:hypothetical protein
VKAEIVRRGLFESGFRWFDRYFWESCGKLKIYSPELFEEMCHPDFSAEAERERRLSHEDEIWKRVDARQIDAKMPKCAMLAILGPSSTPTTPEPLFLDFFAGDTVPILAAKVASHCRSGTIADCSQPSRVPTGALYLGLAERAGVRFRVEAEFENDEQPEMLRAILLRSEKEACGRLREYLTEQSHTAGTRESDIHFSTWRWILPDGNLAELVCWGAPMASLGPPPGDTWIEISKPNSIDRYKLGLSNR